MSQPNNEHQGLPDIPTPQLPPQFRQTQSSPLDPPNEWIDPARIPIPGSRSNVTWLEPNVGPRQFGRYRNLPPPEPLPAFTFPARPGCPSNHIPAPKYEFKWNDDPGYKASVAGLHQTIAPYSPVAPPMVECSSARKLRIRGPAKLSKKEIEKRSLVMPEFPWAPSDDEEEEREEEERGSAKKLHAKLSKEEIEKSSLVMPDFPWAPSDDEEEEREAHDLDCSPPSIVLQQAHENHQPASDADAQSQTSKPARKLPRILLRKRKHDETIDENTDKQSNISGSSVRKRFKGFFGRKL